MNNENEIKRLKRKEKKIRRQMEIIDFKESARQFFFEGRTFNNATYSRGRRFEYKSHYSIAGLISGACTIGAVACMFFFNPVICLSVACLSFVTTIFTNYVIPAKVANERSTDKKSYKKWYKKHEELEEVLNQINDLQGGTRREEKAKVQVSKPTKPTTSKEKKKEMKETESELFSALSLLRKRSQELESQQKQCDNNEETPSSNSGYDGDSDYGI